MPSPTTTGVSASQVPTALQVAAGRALLEEPSRDARVPMADRGVERSFIANPSATNAPANTRTPTKPVRMTARTSPMTFWLDK